MENGKMNRRDAKSGSWSNLRVFSVSFKNRSRNSDNIFAEDASNSFGDSSENTEGEKAWEEDIFSQKSFSSSAIAQNSTATNSEAADSCESTPRVRRKSFRRMIEETFSSSASGTNHHADKAHVLLAKHKTASKRDSRYFNLYTEAVEHNLFSDEELRVWDIQDRFPNDDLRLYEGLFSLEKAESPCSPSSPSAALCMAPTNYIVDPLRGRIMHSTDSNDDDTDVTRSPAIPRKMLTATATVHSISAFRDNHPPQHQSTQSWAAFTSRFPVFAGLSHGLQAKFKKMAQRRQSAPSLVIRGVLGRSKPSSFYGRDESPVPHSPNVNSQRLSLKFGSHGATLNLSKRKYVMEGKVQLTTGMQTQDRYMFLFTDLLLIAKAKSGSNFKLKYRIRVCELWIASCLDDVCELPKTSDKSFVMGWPTTNCVATFSTPESKELWLSALQKKLQQEKEKETPKTIALKVVNRDSSNSSHTKTVTVSHKDTAKDVVRLAAKEFGFESEDEYQLWVMSRKEVPAYPLIGHENPHAIFVSHIRDYISANGILPETEITSIAKYESQSQPEMRDRCQFILRNTRQSPKYSVDMSQKRLSRLKAKTSSSIFNWARKRSGQRNEGSDSGHVSGNSVGSEGTTFFSSSPPSTSPPATPKLFSLPLGQVCSNGELPSPIASMLEILYRKGPYTSGIFRKSANAKTTRHMKHKLDEEIDMNLGEVSIHVVAALVKDFLRNIPDSVMDCLLYAKWAQAIENPDEDEKLKLIRSLLTSLDTCNRVLLRRLAIVLNRIASQSGRNNMTSYNLAVCIAPSLLWPLGPSAQTEAPIKAAEILQYFSERCHDVFDGMAPTDVAWPSEIDLKSDDEDEYEGDNEKSTGTTDGLVSPISDAAPTQKSGELLAGKKEEEETDVPQFSRSGMIRRQLQRRKPGSKAETRRLLSLSQDSLDRVLGEEAISSNQQQRTVDDMLLNGGDMHQGRPMRGRGNHRARDVCSMSNDSGFTTLSGEEEEAAPVGTPRRPAALPASASAGADLDGLANEARESARVANEELRKLWSPSLLKISNGQIIEEDELVTGKEETPDVARGFASGGFIRRQSQPAFSRYHSVSAGGPAGTRRIPKAAPSGGSRLVQAITSPTIEYDVSDDDSEDVTSHFMRQPPKYVRLNDRSDHEDESGLAKEYLRRLRRLSTDDVTENIARSATSSDGGGRHYMNGVTLEIGDVRPPVVPQYRPVTLSIRGIVKPDLRPKGLTNPDPELATSGAKDFFIGDDQSPAGTPDALSSSQEDVFKGWDTGSRSSFGEPRTRSRTAPEATPEPPKTAPLSRKFNSTRARRLNLPLTPDAQAPSGGCMSPIQKLTENLQMLPDFRQRSARKSTSDENHFFGRTKSSSVRERRVPYSASVPTRGETKGENDVVGTSFKAPTAAGSRSSISDASRSSLDSPSRTSLNDESSHATKEEEASSEGDVRLRRLSSRRRCNVASVSPKEGTFSKSLPSSDWNGMKGGSRSLLENRESSRESVKSDGAGRDVARRRRHGPGAREAEIAHVAGAVESKMRELSGLSAPPSDESLDAPTSDQEFRVRAGSVKSKISVFNHMIDSAGAPDSNSPTTPIAFVVADDGEDFRIRRKNAVATPPRKLGAPARHQAAQQNHESAAGKRPEDGGRNGLVIRATPDSLARKNASARIKNVISVKLHTSDDPPRADKPSSNHRRSPQPVSDNLLFTLSESFAFGNRKSPRSITPNGSPRNSPVTARRRRGDGRTARRSCHSPTKTPQAPADRPRTRHASVDHYVGGGSPHSRVHVTSWSVKRNADDGESSNSRHGKPPSARDNNSNEIFPLIGFDSVVRSEESYV